MPIVIFKGQDNQKIMKGWLRMKQFFKIFGISFISFVLVFGLGANWYINSVLGRMVEDDQEGPIVAEDLISGEFGDQSKKPSDRLNIVIIGTDGERSDTIMMASVNTSTKKVDLISIPRDTYYHRQGYDFADQRKINAAYGIRGDFKDRSRSVAMAVSNVLGGVAIDYYIRLDYDAVRKIVDNIDGVPFYVPVDMKYEDPSQDLYIDLKEGQQTLTGSKALELVRYRGYAEADIGRMRMQQEFIKATAKRAMSFSNIIPVIETTASYIRTNMTVSEIQKLAKLAVGFDPSNIDSHILPGASKKMYGLDFYVHDSQRTKVLMEKIYGKEQE